MEKVASLLLTGQFVICLFHIFVSDLRNKKNKNNVICGSYVSFFMIIKIEAD